MMPLVLGRIALMHSKQPQEVIGSLIMLYALKRSSARLDLVCTNSLTFSHCPSFSSTVRPFSIGWLGPVGLISNAARPSSQL